MKVERTIRGFKFIRFEDTYKTKCSVQESSVGGRLWLGVDDARPQVLKRDKGWTPFNIPKEVLLHTRMHLDKKLARKLVKCLSKWIKSDTLK